MKASNTLKRNIVNLLNSQPASLAHVVKLHGVEVLAPIVLKHWRNISYIHRRGALPFVVSDVVGEIGKNKAGLRTRKTKSGSMVFLTCSYRDTPLKTTTQEIIQFEESRSGQSTVVTVWGVSQMTRVSFIIGEGTDLFNPDVLARYNNDGQPIRKRRPF